MAQHKFINEFYTPTYTFIYKITVCGDIRNMITFRVGVYFLYLFMNLCAIIIINKFINNYIYSKDLQIYGIRQFDTNRVNVM